MRIMNIKHARHVINRDQKSQGGRKYEDSNVQRAQNRM